MYQQREVQVERFDAKDQLAKVAPTDAEIEAYYKDPAHAAQFQAPEEASIEYVVLDLESLKKGIAVSEDDLRKYYAENEKRYTSPEERRASHILIKADKDAPKAERDKARAKAEALLAEVRKTPARVRRDRAQELGRRRLRGQGRRPRLLRPRRDGQAVRGRGVRPEAGRDRAASSRATSASTSSRSTGARGGEKKSFESVRAEIENEVRNQLAQKQFADAAVEFGDTVYEQPDSLKPAADKWKLEMKTAQHVTRAPAPGASGALANPQVPRGPVQQRRDCATSATPRRSTSARTSSRPAASSSTCRRTSCRSPR